jgi:MYXO-CTERM domain-containing protein
MSLLFAAALAASATTMPACSWDRPGADPYVGNVVTAVDRYSDIPESVRAALKKRMAVRHYDDIAVIRRDTVVGQHLYSPELRDMHFGQGQVCRTVTRAQWTPTAEERGLVYCESGHCIIVPTVCRNVSRVTRLSPPRSSAATTGGDPAVVGGALPAAAQSPAASEPGPSAEVASDELQFEAPGAGRSFAQQADASQPGRIVSPLPGIDSGDAAVEGPVRVADAGPGWGVGPRPIDTGGVPRSSGGGGVPFIDLAPTGGEFGGTDTTPMPEGPMGPLRPAPEDLPPDPMTVVPEPGLWALWLLGLATLAGAVRRRRPIRP